MTKLDIREVLRLAVQNQASDLHLSVGVAPILRIDGELIPLDMQKLTGEECKRLIYSMLSDSQKVEFERELELDFSVALSGVGRFRVNTHVQKGNVEAAFRTVTEGIRTLEELGLPQIALDLARRRDGMVLVTGPTGMGKTTTLAAMIDQINREKRALIVTVEDPIEYLHQHKKSVIKQREVHADTHSFASALRHVLRQDPDVLCVGEMRDLETISAALTAAETGHLVLTTLHTADAPQTVDRIIDVFPPHQQQQIKIQLGDCLQGVISQQLLPRTDGTGRVVATEVMIATPGVRNLVRTQKTEQLPTAIQTGSEFGMISMDQSLKDLYQRGLITYELAVSKARNPRDFRLL